MNSNESLLNDCYRISGKYFPVPDESTAKGVDNGPRSLVSQSEIQKSPRLNASDGNGSSVKGKEGKSFPPANNSKSSTDESAVFAGSRDASVSLNLTTGQIESTNEVRLVPVPQNRNDNKMRALVKFRKTKADIKENRV